MKNLFFLSVFGIIFFASSTQAIECEGESVNSKTGKLQKVSINFDLNKLKEGSVQEDHFLHTSMLVSFCLSHFGSTLLKVST